MKQILNLSDNLFLSMILKFVFGSVKSKTNAQGEAQTHDHSITNWDIFDCYLKDWGYKIVIEICIIMSSK